jgi:hypothetical protein
MTYIIMHTCPESCCADSPDSPTFAMPCRTDLPDSPTFAEPCCADSPNSPTFAKPCCADSPDSRTLAKGHFRKKCDSPRHICTGNSPFSRIWGEWPLLSFISKLDFLVNNNRFKMEMNSSVFLMKFKKAMKQKNVSNFV